MGMYQYRAILKKGFSQDIGSFESFGIQPVLEASNTVVETVFDVSTDGTFVQRIVDLSNQLELDPIHMPDVVEDALCEQ